jgi:hypothetical protein
MLGCHIEHVDLWAFEETTDAVPAGNIESGAMGLVDDMLRLLLIGPGMCVRLVLDHAALQLQVVSCPHGANARCVQCIGWKTKHARPKAFVWHILTEAL